MLIKKILSLLLILSLAACTNSGMDWGEYPADEYPAGMPENLAREFDYNYRAKAEEELSAQSRQSIPDYPVPENAKVVAVMLPLSGAGAEIGTEIKRAVEIAFFQKQPRDIVATFYDLSGSMDDKARIAGMVLARRPDMVIGPVFSEDARIIRAMKPEELPVLSLTSDPSALGYGVMSVALMPNQSTESILRQRSETGRERVLFLAPDNLSGYMNANAAIESARDRGLHISGLYYYAPGVTDSIKETAERATLYPARAAALARAKEVLSDILIKEPVNAAEKAFLTRQLEALSKKDTIGDMPYDAVLFLGTASDSKTLASFLRYYDLDQKKVKFFGTALWDSPLLFGDITLAGAEYSSLPAISEEFSKIYMDITGKEPERVASMGYDAAMLSILTLMSSDPAPRYLLNPRGFTGIDGLFRLRADGMNERALEIMSLTGGGAPRLKIPAANDFNTPLYRTDVPGTGKPAELEATASINPDDFIRIPEYLRKKYKSQTYGGRGHKHIPQTQPAPSEVFVEILPEDDSDAVPAPDFYTRPNAGAAVQRMNIDEVEITEE
jgi:hypothetical protein